MKPALLVIDLQTFFQTLVPEDNITDNVSKLVNKCYENSTPVVFTQHHDPQPLSVMAKFWNSPIVYGTKGWELRSDIKPLFDTNKAIMIEKTRYDAFWNTNLKEKLLEKEVDTVIVTGVMTNLCCETTARTAFCNDFNVLFAKDASATRSIECHEATLLNIEAGFGKVLETKEILEILG